MPLMGGLGRRAAAALVVVAGAGCAGGSPTPPSSSPSDLAKPSPSPLGSPALVSPSAPLGPECRLEGSVTNAPVPTDLGRCSVGVLTLDVSFVADDGWRWSAMRWLWGLSREMNGYSIVILVYEFGGSVVKTCRDDLAPTVPMARASDVVAWLDTVDGLETAVTARSVGPSYPAWQLDLAASGNVQCGEKGEGVWVSLWEIPGGIFPPASIGSGERIRVYLIELPDTIIVMHAWAVPTADVPDALDRVDDPFEPVEGIFSSLQFEAPRPRATPAPTPVLEARGVTTDVSISSAGLEFVSREGGEASCSSHPGRLDVAAVAALDLGQLGGRTLRAWIEIPQSSARAYVQATATRSDDLPPYPYPDWDGMGTLASVAADGASGSIRFDIEAIRAETWDKQRPEWPKILSGGFSWSCGEWMPAA